MVMKTESNKNRDFIVKKKPTYRTVVVFGCSVVKFPERRSRLTGQEPRSD